MHKQPSSRPFLHLMRLAPAFTFVLAAFFVAAAAPAQAQSSAKEQPPGIQEYLQLSEQAFEQALPMSLNGMTRARVTSNPFVAMGIYSGGEPLPTIAVALPATSGAEQIDAQLQQRVEQGEAVATARAGLTGYFSGPALESVTEGTPALAVPVGDKLIQIKVKPVDDMPAADAIQEQLWAVFEALDAERLTSFPEALLLLASGQLEVSGGADAQLQVTHAFPLIMGGFSAERRSLGLGDKASGMDVRLYFLPADIEPGTYEVHEQPAMLSQDWQKLIAAQFHAGEESTNPNPGYWDEDVTGTLTVESVANGKMSGHLAFEAHRNDAPPVQVRLEFEDLVILDGEL